MANKHLMRVEVVEVVRKEYCLDEADFEAIMNDYDGDIKQYVLNELDPCSEDSEIEEVNYNEDEYNRFVNKMEEANTLDFWLKFGSKQIKTLPKRCVNITDEMYETALKLLPFIGRDVPFRIEPRYVNFLKDETFATDLVMLVRTSSPVEIPAGSSRVMIPSVVKEFSKEDIFVCNNRFIVKHDNKLLEDKDLSNAFKITLTTLDKFKIDRELLGDKNIFDYDLDGEVTEIDGNYYGAAYINKLKQLGDDFKYYIGKDDVLCMSNGIYDAFLSSRRHY